MNTSLHNGVNLGGWLLTEPWLTPSLYKGTNTQDEYSLWQVKDGAKRIQRHRKTFITEEDWRWLADNAITFVRLPVGYWVLTSQDGYVSAKEELDWAFRMAERYGISILLDLHGLKGSQNGHMHSGLVGHVNWRKYESQHIETLVALAKRYRDSSALWGVEIINEPKVLGNYWALLRYYRKAYKALCPELRPGTHIVFQDGFMPPLFSGAVAAKKEHPIVMDTHFYLLPTSVMNRLSPERYDKVRLRIYAMILRLLRWQQPIMVGEWGSVLPQPMLDVVPQKDHLNMLAATINRQRKAYGSAYATCYWNYKAEGRGMYNYRSLVEDKIIE